jgi:RCC1 and BTB domain-containing protein
VAMLYATAIKFQAEELEAFCFRFSLNHMTAMTQTESFRRLDEGTVKEFISKAAKEGAFKS